MPAGAMLYSLADIEFNNAWTEEWLTLLGKKEVLKVQHLVVEPTLG